MSQQIQPLPTIPPSELTRCFPTLLAQAMRPLVSEAWRTIPPAETTPQAVARRLSLTPPVLRTPPAAASRCSGTRSVTTTRAVAILHCNPTLQGARSEEHTSELQSLTNLV